MYSFRRHHRAPAECQTLSTGWGYTVSRTPSLCHRRSTASRVLNTKGEETRNEQICCDRCTAAASLDVSALPCVGSGSADSCLPPTERGQWGVHSQPGVSCWLCFSLRAALASSTTASPPGLSLQAAGARGPAAGRQVGRQTGSRRTFENCLWPG